MSNNSADLNATAGIGPPLDAAKSSEMESNINVANNVSNNSGDATAISTGLQDPNNMQQPDLPIPPQGIDVSAQHNAMTYQSTEANAEIDSKTAEEARAYHEYQQQCYMWYQQQQMQEQMRKDFYTQRRLQQQQRPNFSPQSAQSQPSMFQTQYNMMPPQPNGMAYPSQAVPDPRTMDPVMRRYYGLDE